MTLRRIYSPLVMECNMLKKDAIRVITTCATSYRNNLANHNILFIFGDPRNPELLETRFLSRNYLHLTGVRIKPPGIKSSVDFFNKCLSNQVREEDVQFPDDGVVEMKLSVLPSLMKIHKTAKMIGDYDNNKSVLYTEKLSGTTTACMGFVLEGNYYVPNTALKEDIRQVTIHPQKRILMIMRKPISAKQYEEICYTAKGIIKTDIRFHVEKRIW